MHLNSVCSVKKLTANLKSQFETLATSHSPLLLTCQREGTPSCVCVCYFLGACVRSWPRDDSQDEK